MRRFRHVGGFTNDVMGIGNLLYVARESGRVAVIPPFFGELDFYESGKSSGESDYIID